MLRWNFLYMSFCSLPLPYCLAPLREAAFLSVMSQHKPGVMHSLQLSASGLPNLLVQLRKDPWHWAGSCSLILKWLPSFSPETLQKWQWSITHIIPYLSLLPCWQIPVTYCTQFYPTLTSDAIHTNLCLLECLAEVAGWRIAHCTGTIGRQRTQTSASLAVDWPVWNSLLKSMRI